MKFPQCLERSSLCVLVSVYQISLQGFAYLLFQMLFKVFVSFKVWLKFSFCEKNSVVCLWILLHTRFFYTYLTPDSTLSAFYFVMDLNLIWHFTLSYSRGVEFMLIHSWGIKWLTSSTLFPVRISTMLIHSERPLILPSSEDTVVAPTLSNGRLFCVQKSEFIYKHFRRKTSL